MKTLYTLTIYIFSFLVRIAAPFNRKAFLWSSGRKNWASGMREKIGKNEKIIWIHCASLGEFEQGRPVAEAIRERMPEYKILITFFSPSGYEIRKNWKGADYIFYLPADTPRNAKRISDIVKPSVVIFVKYEFWANLISELKRREIPILLISAMFRPDQHFFRWYGGFFRKIPAMFTHIFVQDKRSYDLVESLGIENAEIAGDTRFDRVMRLAATDTRYEIIGKFAGGEKVIVAGSSWQPDEEIIARYIRNFPSSAKWIIAPHEIGEQNIQRLMKLFAVPSVRYSDPGENPESASIMIIDNIGMLSSVYAYAAVAVIGGGFGKGIHNILEPACHAIPVLFGPNHLKFREATELIAAGGAFTYANYSDFEQHLNKILGDQKLYSDACSASDEYVKSNTGATKKIVDLLIEKRY